MQHSVYYPHLATLLRDITLKVGQARLHQLSKELGVNIAHWNVDSIPATVCGMPVVDLQGVTFGWYLKPKKIVH